MGELTANTVVEVDQIESKKYPLLVDLFFRLIKEKPLGTIGLVLVLILAITAILADFIAPYGYNDFFLADRLTGPSIKHLLGTDNTGRDMFSRIVFGARISIVVGLAGAALSGVVATLIGLISGFAGGKTDIIIQRFVDAWMCFPSLFLYLTFMSLAGPGIGQVIMVLGVTRGISQSRVIRGAVIGIKENMYVEAARAIGASTPNILWRHILPNVLAPVITLVAVASGYMILSEATLSFLGFGIPPPAPSWGGMLSGPARQFMYIAPWMVLWPGLSLAITVYGLNMFGDAVRDLLDPRLRGGLGRYGRIKTGRPKE